MKKIFAVVVTLAMLLSLGSILASAELPSGVTFATGGYNVESADEFEAVGNIEIQWDPDASTKLNLKDGVMDDWAGYESKTIDLSNMIYWEPHNKAPEGWNITTYFVADSEWLYIGFYITDPKFAYGGGSHYDGDAFQICIDFGGKLGQKVEEDPDSLTNLKNIFYSFSIDGDGTPIQIKREESDRDGWLSEANGDGVKGSGSRTATGWCAEFALSFEQLSEDYKYKTWEDDKKIYVGGEYNEPLKIGCCLYYLDRDETGSQIINWAAATTNGIANDDGVPMVSWTCYDNGIQLELPIEDGVTFKTENIVILASGETEPPEVEEEEEEEEEEETTAPATEAPTTPATEAPTDAATDDATTDEGCASVVAFGAVAVLAAAAAAVVLKKKD